MTTLISRGVKDGMRRFRHSGRLQGRCAFDCGASAECLDQGVSPDYQCPLWAGAGTAGKRHCLFSVGISIYKGMQALRDVTFFATDWERPPEDEG